MRFLRFSLIATTAMTLMGCSSVKLIDLDNELATTYVAFSKLETDLTRKGELAKDRLVLVSPTYQARLADISQRAEAEGDKAKNKLDAVGFYRVAAVAAWKGTSKSAETVPALATKGRAVCDSLDKKAESAPRDCYLLAFVEPFTLADFHTDKLQSLYARNQLENAGVVLQDNLVPEGRTALRGLKKAFDDAADVYDQSVLAVRFLPAEFITDFAKTNLNDIRCNYSDGFGVVEGGVIKADVPESVLSATDGKAINSKIRDIYKLEPLAPLPACRSAGRTGGN
jgi:hypothetical protein